MGSFFNPIFSLFTIITRIFSDKLIIIAPKGEFFNGALSQKYLKKFLVLKLFKLFEMFLSIKWHVTSKSEEIELKKLFNSYEKNTVISSNISVLNVSNFKQKLKFSGQLNVLICGRLSPVKNILMSLDCVFELKENINVEIWGVIDDFNYWRKCQKKINPI